MRHRPLSLRLTACLVLAAQFAPAIPAFAVTPATTPAPAPATGAAARPAAATLLRRAMNLYTQARYDEAVTTLFGPVNAGDFQGIDLRDARVLMARCYVKKGLTARAKDLFTAVVAAEPAFVLDASRADAEEVAVFNQVKPAASSSRAQAQDPKRPAAPADKPAPRRPNIGPVASPGGGGSWLARHKVLAAALVVGSGSAALAIASSGGGSSSPKPPTKPDLPGFPPPPPTP
jgi:hypothetical protein